MHIYSVLQFSPKHNNKIKVIFVIIYFIYGYSSNPKSHSIPKFNTYSTQFWGAHIWLIVVYYSYIWNHNHDNTILPTSHSIWFASCVIWEGCLLQKLCTLEGWTLFYYEVLWILCYAFGLCIYRTWTVLRIPPSTKTYDLYPNLCNAEPLNPKL